MIVADLSSDALRARVRDRGIGIRVGPFAARVVTSVPEVVEALGFLYADYPVVSNEEVADFEVRLDSPASVRRWVVPRLVAFIDGKRRWEPFDRRQALPMLEWILNWCQFTRSKGLLLFHCAAVERGGRAILMPGAPGAGKSTLCAALVLRGWRLLSDEIAALRPGEPDLVPVPRPVGLKEDSIEAIRELEPAAELGPACPGTRKGRVAHLRPPADSVHRARQRARPAWIVLPDYRSGASTRFGPLFKAPVAMRLARQAFNYAEFGLAGFEALGDLVDACDCYGLRYGGLEEAIRVLDGLVEAPATPRRAGRAASHLA